MSALICLRSYVGALMSALLCQRSIVVRSFDGSPHMGKGNKELSYVMGGKVLKVSEEERDLGVIMDRSAKPSRQCAETSKKANSTVGMIRRTIVTRDKDTILRLYKTLVRPQLEYGIQVKILLKVSKLLCILNLLRLS